MSDLTREELEAIIAREMPGFRLAPQLAEGPPRARGVRSLGGPSNNIEALRKKFLGIGPSRPTLGATTPSEPPPVPSPAPPAEVSTPSIATLRRKFALAPEPKPDSPAPGVRVVTVVPRTRRIGDPLTEGKAVVISAEGKIIGGQG